MRLAAVHNQYVDKVAMGTFRQRMAAMMKFTYNKQSIQMGSSTPNPNLQIDLVGGDFVSSISFSPSFPPLQPSDVCGVGMMTVSC